MPGMEPDMRLPPLAISVSKARKFVLRMMMEKYPEQIEVVLFPVPAGSGPAESCRQASAGEPTRQAEARCHSVFPDARIVRRLWGRLSNLRRVGNPPVRLC